MDRFKLVIKALENGWANLLILFNEQEITLYFENTPNDPLYGLLESAIKIADNIESTITLHNCSQSTCLSVKMLADGFCCVEVDSIYIDLSVKQFCKAILRMFDAYTFAFSKEEYSNNWRTFSEAELERLRVLYYTL